MVRDRSYEIVLEANGVLNSSRGSLTMRVHMFGNSVLIDFLLSN